MINSANIYKIKCFIFDYDGVLSDGSVYMLPSGEGLRKSNVKDGYALHHAVRNGYHVAVISGGKGENMLQRMNSLGITDVFLGVSYKLDAFDEYLRRCDILPDEVLCMGDDIPDYEIVRKAGIGACPANASEEIKSVADYISPFNGGCGAVRDVIEQVMKVHGKWMGEASLHW